MKTLVTGANGFAGAHLLRELLQGGSSQVIAASLDGSPAPGFGAPGIEWVPLDVTSDTSVRSVIGTFRPERVYHLAGQSSVSQSFSDPLTTWEINATGTLRLLHALEAAASGARVLVISSAEVYGAVHPRDLPIREEQAIRPITPYGASKAAAEIAAVQIAAAAEVEVEVVIARSFNHIGPGQDQRFAIPSMAHQLARIRLGAEEPVLRVGNLEAQRDFLDVRDVAAAYRVLMESGESGEAYNVSSGEARSLQGMVESLVALSGTGARLEVDPARFRPADIPLLVGDATRLRSLGWQPRFTVEEALRDLLNDAWSA